MSGLQQDRRQLALLSAALSTAPSTNFPQADWTVVEVEVDVVAPVAGVAPVNVCKYPLHLWVSAAAFPLTGAQGVG